jgi:membrane protease YdiL (CAAX protease family)
MARDKEEEKSEVSAFLNSMFGRVCEVALVFALPIILIQFAAPYAADNLVAIQGVLWIANVLMLLLVWQGLRLRGEGWAHFGLRFGRTSRQSVARAVLLSFAVFVGGLTAYLIGGWVAQLWPSVPAEADLSRYDFLQGNLPMLLLSLLGVYVVSSFGEEVVYRGFLINRIAELKRNGHHMQVFALLGSSLLFGLAHWDWGLAGVVQTGFFGLGLGIAYLLVGRNLWINVLPHGYMDTILLVALYRAAPG